MHGGARNKRQTRKQAGNGGRNPASDAPTQPRSSIQVPTLGTAGVAHAANTARLLSESGQGSKEPGGGHPFKKPRCALPLPASPACLWHKRASCAAVYRKLLRCVRLKKVAGASLKFPGNSPFRNRLFDTTDHLVEQARRTGQVREEFLAQEKADP